MVRELITQTVANSESVQTHCRSFIILRNGKASLRAEFVWANAETTDGATHAKNATSSTATNIFQLILHEKSGVRRLP